MRLSDHTPDLNNAMDMTGFIPARRVDEDEESEVEYTHECMSCGFDIWNVQVQFGDYQVLGYMLEMSCASCGTKMTAPTEIDHPDYRDNDSCGL